MADKQLGSFAGMWQFTHWFPNKDDTKKIEETYRVRAHQSGNKLILQSVPEDSKKSYMLVRLTIDGEVASGSWHETANPDGEFHGAQYSGAGQMIIDDDGDHMEGEWVGAGLDRKVGKMRTYIDKWALKRIGE